MKTLTLLAVLASGIVSGQITYDCLYEETKPSLKLQVKKVNGNPVSVKYKGQKESIPLKYYERQFYSGGEGTTYKEIYKGKEIGEYRFTFIRGRDVVYYENYVKNREYAFVHSFLDRKSPCFK